MTKHLVTITATVTLLIIVVFYQAIFQVLLMIGYTAAALLALVGLGGLFFGAWYLKERIRMIRAARIEAEKLAHVMTITDNGQTWVRDTDQQSVWRNLTGSPTLYVNGQQVKPEEWELELYRLRLMAQVSKPAQIIPGQAQLLPALPTPIDLLAALDSVQRCLIVGASDTGKTTLLRWLITRRHTNSKVIVIDPHSYPGKWQANYVIGTGRNYVDIDRALTALVQIMTKRYGEIGRGEVGEGQHPRLTVIIDEWRAIVYNVKGADTAIKTLLTESRKAAFSVFVASHSERVKALGIEGEGDLKDGFAVIRLVLVNGQRQATIDTGSGEIPAILPGPHYGPIETSPASEDFTLEIEPTPQEVKILEMAQSGASFNEIARAVFGNTGGKQTQTIKDVLAKFDQN